MSRDTVSPNAPGTQGYNPYAYVANNPTTWVDPSGHESDAVATTFWLLEAAFRIQQYRAPIIEGSALVAEGSWLQKIGGGLELIFMAVACALVMPCRSLTDFLDTTIDTYGSTAAAGAWKLSGQATRYGWQHFPELPPSPVCALGAAEGVATNAVAGAVGRNHSSVSDTILAAATGCVFGGSGGGQPAGPNIIRKAEQETIAVIGRRVDTAVAKEWAKHEILDLPPGEWKQEINDAWIEGIHSITCNGGKLMDRPQDSNHLCR